MPRVLLAEDDGVIARAMMAHLRRAGMDVEWAEDGDRALKKIRFERPDVAVIDLMLPGEDGWRITRTLREEGITIPVIMISARGSEHDKVHGLKIGADDYLAKPFGMQELVARVEAGLRRMEFRLLYVLAAAEGKALTRDRIQQRVWGTPYRHRDRTVDVCVRKLREKIDRRSPTHTYIHTHQGVGYRFEPISKE